MRRVDLANVQLSVPATWRKSTNRVGYGQVGFHRCGLAGVHVTTDGRPDGVESEGHRCSSRTERQTIEGVQLECVEFWEADGLGAPRFDCPEVMKSAKPRR